MTQQEVAPVRFFLGLFALVAVTAQFVVIPRTAAHYAAEYPDVAHLEPLYATALILALVCFEVALLAASLLISIATKRALTDRVLFWTNTMTASLILTAVILGGICIHAGSIENIGGPAMLLGLLTTVALIPATLVLRSWVNGWFAHNKAPALSASR